jgi:DNA-binding FrmR family transcriptional regulator
MNDGSRKDLKVRLNRISGQVSGIGRMIDEDKYCVDILNQIAAVRSALNSLGTKMLTEHLESCVIGHGSESAHSCAQPMTKEELLNEVRGTLSNFLK